MKVLSTIFILIILYSCNKSDSLPRIDQTGRKIFYSYEDYDKMENKHEEIVLIDTACINAKERALNDIRSNKLTYYYNTIGPNEKEFKAELKKFNITAELGNMSTDIVYGRLGDNCYEREMEEELNRRYGVAFFNSIWNKTLTTQMKKFPNDSIEENGKVIRWKDVYKSLLK